MRFWFRAGLLLILSCASLCANEKPDVDVQNVEYCQLAKDPTSFAGKRIRVRAIYRYGFELQLLEPPACCAETGAKIWVQITAELDDRSEKLFRKKLNKRAGIALVVFGGTFESGGAAGPFGVKSRLLVDRIDKIERTGESNGRSADPNWVPRCLPSGGAQGKE